jgi:hypothetical protein
MHQSRLVAAMKMWGARRAEVIAGFALFAPVALLLYSFLGYCGTAAFADVDK